MSSDDPEPAAVLRPGIRATASGPPRLLPSDEVPDDLLEFLRKIEGGDHVHRLFLTLAHNPRVTKRVGLLVAGLLGNGTVPAREREIIILRIAWRCGAVYEFGEHTRMGLDAGLTPAEILELTGPAEAMTLAADERSLVTLADELYDANTVSDETWALLAARWAPEQLVEMVCLAGFYWMVAGVLNTFRVESEAGSPRWPEGLTPPGWS